MSAAYSLIINNPYMKDALAELKMVQHKVAGGIKRKKLICNSSIHRYGVGFSKMENIGV